MPHSNLGQALAFAAIAAGLACSGGTGTSSATSGTSTAVGANGGTTTGTSGTGTTGGASTSGSASTGGSTSGQIADAGDTWTSWASAQFFQPYCVSCHSPGNQGDPSGSGLDWTQYTEVVAAGATIRCGVAVAQDPSWNCTVSPEQFPIGNGAKPTAADRDRLVAWIDAGMPQ